MEKNIYQKAKEYGLITGYIPKTPPTLLVQLLKGLADAADKDDSMKGTATVFRDAAAIVEMDIQTMEAVVNSYEQGNRPRSIKVFA